MAKDTTHRVFHSMGIAVHCTLVGVSEKDAEDRIALAEKIFSEYDIRFSRFKETSELHLLNINSETPQKVSIEMFQVLKKCVALAEQTGGAFDPSVGGVLASFGYGLPTNYTAPNPPPTYRDIKFNDQTLEVTLALGQVLEPASVVKSLAIDEAAKSFRDVPGFLLNAGGDILTHGAFEIESVWNIAIQDPRDARAIVAAVGIKDAGMATSGVYQTRGVKDGKPWHHLVDMRTRENASGITSVTVVAPTCEQADSEATLTILLGTTAGTARLDQTGFPYFLIFDDGTIKKNAAFAALEIPFEKIISANE
jgi:thiamine biosynthesis lipoprotein